MEYIWLVQTIYFYTRMRVITLNGQKFWGLFILLGSILLVGFFAVPHITAEYTIYTVDTGSMEPKISTGSDILVKNYSESNHTIQSGDIILYRDQGDPENPLIVHRVDTSVTEGEDWINSVNQEYMPQNTNCDSVNTCPAKHDGYITYGDNNFYNDQFARDTDPIKKEWIEGILVRVL